MSARCAGLSLVEMMVTLAIFGILVVTVFSIAVQTHAFVGDQDVEYTLITQVNRAGLRLSEMLRKSGWVTRGGDTYPRVSRDRKELEFLVLADLDGNGYPFDQATGELEWDSRVFTVRRDPKSDTLFIYEGDKPVWTVARHIKQVDFATYLENSALTLNEIEVDLSAARDTPRGEQLQVDSLVSFQMRN